AQPLQERSRARTAHLDLGERREVEQAGGFAASAMLGLDGRRPQPPGPTARPHRFVPPRRIGLEPVDALLSRLLADSRTTLAQPRICRRCAQRAAGAALVAWELHVV